ncbi:MAG: tRNA uridine-5-carboxymethylaminomethyl(34) synthesis GTPase MnmE, partial [Pseudomonadota bacterium]
MSYTNDTIVALATARGQAGVGIVRLSGPDAIAIAGRLVPRMPPPRQASLQVLSDATGDAIDQGIVLCFPAPHSYTGEDVVELQCHGSPIVLDSIVRTLCESGARLARNGEFSERAFLNDKLDLAQAEAIADLIESGS